MKQVTFSYPGADYNAIAATQSWTTATGAYVVINGDYSRALQGTPGQNADRVAVLPGIQRTIGVFSTGNLTGVVFLVSGLDTNGRVVTASFAGASGGSSSATDAFATFTAEFSVINYIYATSIASSVFTVGTGATGSTRWYTADGFPGPFNTAVTVVTTTGLSVTVQSTPNNPNLSTAPTTFDHATGAMTANTMTTGYSLPVPFIRAVVTTGTGQVQTSTQASITIQQSGV